MQLALGALANLGIGGGAAAAGAAGAAGGAAAGLSALQGIGAAIGILGTIGQGFAKAAETRHEADQATLQAGQEQVGAQQRALQMKRELLRTLGENDVAFAGAGIDTSQGIAAVSRANNVDAAGTQLSIDRADADFRRALLDARAKNLRSRASGEIGGALLSALGQGISAATSSYKLGVT